MHSSISSNRRKGRMCVSRVSPLSASVSFFSVFVLRRFIFNHLSTQLNIGPFSPPSFLSLSRWCVWACCQSSIRSRGVSWSGGVKAERQEGNEQLFSTHSWTQQKAGMCLSSMLIYSPHKIYCILNIHFFSFPLPTKETSNL